MAVGVGVSTGSSVGAYFSAGCKQQQKGTLIISFLKQVHSTQGFYIISILAS